ncbi:MAG: sensor histidine kinase [Bacillota bacterium]|jgi:signal transduction histidine kinase
MLEALPDIFIVTLAIVAHLTAYIQLRLDQTGQKIFPPQWSGQCLFLLGLSLFLALLMPLYRKRRSLIRVTLLIRACILVLIGLPFGAYLGIEMTLLSFLIVEIFHYCSIRESIIFSLLLTGGLAALQQPVKAWGRILPAGSAHDVVSFLVFILMIILLSAVIRYRCDNQVTQAELNRCLDETTLQLTEANLRLQEYAAISEAEAKANERKRLAREIHDTLAYTLTNLVMMLEAAIDMSSDSGDELAVHLRRARDQAKEGLVSVRDALRALRPAPVAEEGGLIAIYRLVHTFTAATRIQVDLNLGDVPAYFGAEADWTAYRLVQEGITNALRHGKATLIAISFCREHGGVRIRIKDNGKSLTQTPQEGYGLQGMRERVERLEGHLSFGYEAGKGFTISAWLPLKEG